MKAKFLIVRKKKKEVMNMQGEARNSPVALDQSEALTQSLFHIHKYRNKYKRVHTWVTINTHTS